MQLFRLPALIVALSLATHASALTLSQRISASDAVVLGTVTSVVSNWNSSRTMIYSTATILVNEYCYGFAGNEIEFIYAGGRVGNEMVTATSSPGITLGSYGMFFFESGEAGKLNILPGYTGYISIAKMGAVSDGVHVFAGETELKNEVSNLSGQAWKHSFTPDPDRAFSRNSTSFPLITGFSPTSATAGTGSVITITGSGFGSTRGNGKVLFTNADVAGLVRNVEPFSSQYIVWSDTVIQVEVPSLGVTGTGTAGTGTIEVVNNSGNSFVSIGTLSVSYSVVNLDDNGTSVRPDMINDNGAGGYTYRLYDSLALNADTRQTFFRALERWTCATQANYFPDYSSASTATVGMDGINVVRFDSMNTILVGVVYSFYSNCSGNWYLIESDLVFNNQLNWNFSQSAPSATQIDFESTCVTLIGFTMLADHVVNASDPMHGEASLVGTSRRSLTSNNINGVLSTLAISTVSNSCGPSAHQIAANCTVGGTLDADVNTVEWPYTGFCQGTFPVRVNLINRGVQSLTSATINWSYDGIPQTVFSWSGNVLHDDTVSVTIGTHLLTAGTHTIIAWTDNPNSGTDVYSDNDSANSVVVIGSCTSANAGVNQLTTPTVSMCPGNHPVAVTIRNFATTPLNYAQIHWKVNGVLQTPVVWTGTLASNSISAPITLGTYNFSSFTNTIQAWTVYPNGLNDAVVSNDTLNGIYNPNGMVGVYTVGGASPDFPNFQTAISNLNSRGLCGPVILDVRPGTYLGASILSAPTSSTNTLLIRSSNGDSSTVIISNSSGDVLTVNGSDYVTIEKVTFQTTDPTSSQCLYITNDANNITVRNCAVLMPLISLANQNVNGVNFAGTPCDYLQVINCRIVNGSGGIGAGASPGTGNGLIIKDCQFLNQRQWSLNINYYNGITVQYNDFDNSLSSGVCVYIQNCDGGGIIDHNKMVSRDVSVINIETSYATQATPWNVTNNFMAITNCGSGSGVILYQTAWVSFIHNTIHGYCRSLIYLYVAPNNTIHPRYTFANNIFSNTLQSSNIFNTNFSLQPLDPFETLSHNAYSSVDAIARLGSLNVYSLSQWTGYAQADTNAVLCDPLFVSSVDLHLVSDPANIPLFNAGWYSPSVNVDIDGQTRSANPEIGADEFAPAINDVAVSAVNPSVRSCVGFNPVSVILTNMGTSALTSTVINWTVNNVAQPSYNWAGSLATNASSVQITIGNYNFLAATAYSIVVWTSQPNNSTDGNINNDSAMSVVTGGGMSGIYTVGGASPNYASLTAAKNALQNNGVCGPVVFNIRPGTYNELVTYPAISGASEINTITFQAENGDSSTVVLSGGTSVPVVVTGGYYTFYRVTITSSQSCFNLNGCVYTTISNCNVQGRIIGNTGVTDHAVIRNNRIGDNVYLNGYTASNGNFNIVYKHTNLLLENNYFPTGNIELNELSNARIENNNLSNSSVSSGIVLTNVYDTLTLTRNRVRTFGSYGMRVVYKVGPAGYSFLVSNNMVMDSSSTGVGVSIESYQNADVLYNTIVCAAGQYTNALYMYADANITFRVIGNSITHKSGGGALSYYYSTLGSNSVFESDYNSYYSTGSTLITAESVPYGSLASWNIASGNDANSLFALPLFTSPTDLHLNNDVNLSDMGLSLVEVPDDVDGNTRSSAPDIGADEFVYTPLSLDAGVRSVYLPLPTCPGSIPVRVNIRNYGSTALTSCVVNWTLNGVIQPAYNWSGNLSFMDSTGAVQIGTAMMLGPNSYDISAWISSPNGGSDQAIVNDSAHYFNYLMRLNGNYTVGGVNPDFISINQVLTVLQQRGICGPVVFNLRAGGHPWSNVALSNVPGSGPLATVTFRSENGDSTSTSISSINLGGASWISFHQVTLSGALDYGTNTSHINFTNCVFNNSSQINSGQNQRFLFQHNRFTTYISFAGTSSALPESGNRFVGNSFVNCSYLLTTGQRGLEVTGNTFECNTNTSYAALTVSSFSDSCEVTRNYINGSYGDGLTTSGASGFNVPIIIANNMFTGALGEAINIGSGIAPTCIYSNSINVTGTGTGIYMSNSNVRLFNNIISVNTGIACFVNTANALDSSDYNCIYTSGAILYRWLSTNCATLPIAQAASGMEVNSISVNPLFVSPADLHILNNALDGAARPLADVTTDFDGDLRASTPDIGADERLFVPNDAGVLSLIQPVPACEGGNTFSIRLKNYGTQILTSATIQWALNGVPQTPLNWTGSISVGGQATITLGSATLPHGTIVLLQSWSENPNSVADQNNVNDTLTINILPRMSGTFTIGGVAPDYTTFTAAVADLTTFGVCGDVFFNVRNGTYNEQIVISSIVGASAINTIIFQSENNDSSLVTLSYFSGSANNYVIQMNSSKYVTFREITIQALNPQYGKLVVASDTLISVNFENIYFLGSTTQPAVPYDHVLVRMDFDPGSADCYVRNCYLKGGGVGIFLHGQGVNNDTSSFVIDNRIEDQYLKGILFQQQYYQIITGNVVVSTTSVHYSYAGIESSILNSNSYLAYNHIALPWGTPMSLADWGGGSIVNNFLTTHQDTSNNYIFGALSLSHCGSVDIFHNTLIVYGYRKFGRALTISSASSGNEIKNNIIANMGGAGVAVYWDQQTNLINNVLDNNAYYTCCSDTLIYGYTVQVQTVYTDLAAWQTATNQDLNSIIAPPQNLSPFDARIFSNIFLDNEGDASVPVNDDLSHQIRGVTPDIGADEFTSLANDLAVVYVRATNANCGGGNVRCQIGNFGTNTVTSAEIHWTVNGIPQPTYMWSGTLLSAGYSAQIVLGSYTFATGDVLQAWTALPNGNPDSYAATDTAVCAVIFSVNQPDLGPDDTICSGSIVVLNPGVYPYYVWSTGATSSTLAVTTSGIYSVIVMTSDSCYMYDTVSVFFNPSPAVPVITQNGANLLSSSPTGNQWLLNGVPISGANGQLYLALQSGQYSVIVTDANGCTATSAPVVVVGISDSQATSLSVQVYPVPNSGQFVVLIKFIDNVLPVITLYDLNGRIVQSETEIVDDGNTKQVNITTHAESGVYLVEIVLGEFRFMNRIIIQ